MEENQAQRKAIRHGNGPMLVLAGPGSGKTRVITERTRYLIEQKGVRPEEILVITFTKAAAMEMRERFAGIMGNPVPPVTFGTFHAVFFRVLKYAYGYTAESIVREEQRTQIIREAMEKENLEIQDEPEFIQGILSEIGMIKNDRLELADYLPMNCGKAAFLRIYRYYEKRLHDMRLMDFDDMLVYCYELFEARKDILAGWQRKYRYILVDEFQDVNRIQYEITKMLAGREENLFVVGDDDQSIYRFRGARPEIMLNFRKDFPAAQEVLLDINYRCQAKIVERALCLIGHNKTRYPKEIRAAREGTLPVGVHEFRTMKEEVKWILTDIREKLSKGIPAGEIAVLYRTGNQPRPLLEKLMEYNVPFALREGLPDIYQHWIAGNLISYIRIARGSRERRDFLAVMNRPNRYISREAISTMQISFENLRDYYREKDWMADRIDKFWYDTKMIAKMNPYGAIHYIRHVVGYEEYVREYAKNRHIPEEELFEVLEELAEGAKGYADFDSWFAHIEEYQQEWREQMLRKKDRGAAVSFMTMHGAKGLEYQVVYILEANEEITPHKKAVTEEEIEEERRMFYVAMTRAKDELQICSVGERYSRKLLRSRFLGEMTFDRSEMQPGRTIVHRKYGKGTITKVDGEKAELFFEQEGRRLTVNVIYCIQNGILKTE